MVRRFAVVLVLLAAFGSAAPAQTPQTGRVMREKLGHSQKILEAIMTSDFASLERHSMLLERATKSPAWTVLTSPEYVQQSAAFLRAARALVEAAQQRDLDAAAMRYLALTQSCFACHQHMKRARVVTQ